MMDQRKKNRGFDTIWPYAAVVGGVSTDILTLVILNYFIPGNQNDVAWTSSCAISALLSGLIVGRLTYSEQPWIMYNIWGLIFTGVNGAFTTAYLLLTGVIQDLGAFQHEHLAHSGFYNFIIVAQSFAIGGLSAKNDPRKSASQNPARSKSTDKKSAPKQSSAPNQFPVPPLKTRNAWERLTVDQKIALTFGVVSTILAAIAIATTVIMGALPFYIKTKS